ncbi:Cyn operon transcriptional activator [Chromobacterium violaceum]|uniref:Cyn operon transcriptional activator n=1 Tax=Chromobacterium violaceum TaxID=536 RepID=A0A3S4HQH6_CHRVL|nr:Cyn operon transcriptional activator [Chromobacterium violaceum]
MRDLDAGRRALHDVATLQRGQLRLAMTPTFTAWLAGPLLARFHRRHPGIALTVREMSQEAMEAGLAEDILDIGIGFAPARTLDVEAMPLLDERLALIAGDSHPLAAREAVLSLADLEAMPLVLLSADFITRRHVDDYCLRHGIRPTVAVEVNSMGAAVEIIRHGELAGILPAAVAASQPGLSVLALSPALPAARPRCWRNAMAIAARPRAPSPSWRAQAWALWRDGRVAESGHGSGQRFQQPGGGGTQSAAVMGDQVHLGLLQIALLNRNGLQLPAFQLPPDGEARLHRRRLAGQRVLHHHPEGIGDDGRFQLALFGLFRVAQDLPHAEAHIRQRQLVPGQLFQADGAFRAR